MLRVGFDDQIFRAQRRGGVSRYFVELISRLPQFGVEPVLFTGPTHNRHAIEAGISDTARDRSKLVEVADWFTWRALGRPRTRVQPGADVALLHHTFTHPAYLADWSGPRVTTLHDMTPELFPGQFRLGNPHFAKRRYYDECDLIIAVSENTQQDLERFYGPRQGSTEVVHLGVDEAFLDYSSPRPRYLPDDYLLFVGVRDGYKDFATAREAWRLVRTNGQPDLHLVLVGGADINPKELAGLSSAERAAIHHYRPTDYQLPALYAHASAFVFPSKYEGFGLPTIEALATGTPPVLAEASCMPEIGGNEAWYFTPGDPGSAADAISAATQCTPNDRIAMRARARRFSWDAMAERTAHAYRIALGEAR